MRERAMEQARLAERLTPFTRHTLERSSSYLMEGKGIEGHVTIPSVRRLNDDDVARAVAGV